MKKLFYLITILISANFVQCSGQTLKNIDPNTNLISIGIREQLYSQVLGEEREIWVHVPKSSANGQKYPVIYLLDGEFHFESVVGIVRANVINNNMPNMIIVAITNTNRYRDLSTSHVGDDSDLSGGGQKFTNFIENELIPHVDKNYPTLSHRTLIGHSLGGLLVSNTLINHSSLFNNYLAIDPSLSWNNRKLLNESKSKIQESDYKKKSIYIAIANTINNNGSNNPKNFEDALKDTTTATLHLRPIFEFSEILKSKKELHSEWKYYPNETHATLPVVALHESVRFLFSWYKFNHWNEFYMPEPRLSGKELVKLIVSHHNNISNNLGQIYLPNQREINRLAYMYLDKKDYKRALPFFELNVKNFPKSANAYDSLGDYYNSVLDKDNAVKYFTKSLDFGGAPNTKEKLEKLIK